MQLEEGGGTVGRKAQIRGLPRKLYFTEEEKKYIYIYTLNFRFYVSLMAKKCPFSYRTFSLE